jgi:predicted amidohydrolase YtcJ/SAM-dependent methyltransferase
VVLQRIRHERPQPEGATLERVGVNEAVTQIVFLGRRRRVYARIAALSGARRGDAVLDVGCGGGYLARLLAAAVTPGGHVTGVDPAGAAISYARRRAPGNCSFAVGVAQDLHLPDGSFDVVTCTLAVHHIPEAERPAAFGEMYRVLRPGGALLVADFRPAGRRLALHSAGRAMRHGNAVPLEELAAAAGFRVEARGDLPLLRYIRAVPPTTRNSPDPASGREGHLMCTVVLANARVITCDERGTTAEAIAIRDGRVLAVGDSGTVRANAGPDAQVADLGGHTVIPGLVDTHPHLLHFGALAEPLVDLADATSHADIVARLAARAAETSPGEWIMATPVGEPHYFIRRSFRDLAEGRLPGRRTLDRATTDHPVMIQAWAPVTPNTCAFNSLALGKLGITAGTPDRAGTVWIGKDADGRPNGLLHGSVTNYYATEPFMAALLRQLPLVRPEAIIPGALRAMQTYNAMGVTTVYEAHAMDFAHIEAYRWLRAENKLTVRVQCAPDAEPYGFPTDRPLTDEEFAARLAQASAITERGDDMLRIDGITFSRGGPLWPGLLLMREPYRGPFGELTTGTSFVAPERAARVMRYCLDQGLRLNIVTAGLGEHDTYLGQLEALGRAPLAADGRPWLLQHLYFVEPEQARRFATLGLQATTSMSFSWGKGELVRERLGEPYLEHLIPLRRLADAGLLAAAGTDWGPKNVFEHVALAVRPYYAGSGRPGATPGISRYQALAMWTRDAARVLGWDGIGTLCAGDHADLAILDRDPLTAPLDELPGTQVITTMVDGTTVHGTDPTRP